MNNHLVWLEIDKKNLIHNIGQFKKIIGQRKLCCVVKSNAYGHGLAGVVKIITDFDKNIWLGVNSIEEAAQIRQDKINNHILILGYVPLEKLKEAVLMNIRLTVYNLETIQKLGALKMPVNIHLKLETGTGRQGILPEDILAFTEEIKKYPHIKIEGLSTHFANIEDTTNPAYAKRQLKIFNQAIELLKKNGIIIPIRHTACTAASILYQETYFEMARVGLGLYGLWPSRETYVLAKRHRKKIDLKPILSWKTKIAQIKKMPAGSCISYGCTEKLAKDSILAVLPVGYFDGYDRKLSSIGSVLIHGQRAKVLGRVCMNMIIVDVSHIPDVKIEDEAILLGSQGDEFISAEELAAKIGTINYEVIARINFSLPRFFI